MLERIQVGEPGATSRLVESLACDGIALLGGVTDADTLLTVARSFATVVAHRDSRPDGVTMLVDHGLPRSSSGFAGFTSRELAPHTDRSSIERPPGLLLTACGRPAETGGECVVIDGAAVYDDLAEREPEALQALATPRSALFGGAAGYLGSIFAVQPEGRVHVRLRLDELATFSPAPTHWLATLRTVLDRQALTVALHAGEGYVLDNRRWLHGRRAFTGSRVLYRVTADPLPRLGIPTGFLPGNQVQPPSLTEYRSCAS